MRAYFAQSLVRAVYTTSGSSASSCTRELLRLALPSQHLPSLKDFQSVSTREVAKTIAQDPQKLRCEAVFPASVCSHRYLHTFVPPLASSSGDSGSDSDSSSSSAADDRLAYLADEDDDSEEESEQWKQFRDVGDGRDDEDADHVDAAIPEERFVLSGDVRRKGADTLNAADARAEVGEGVAAGAADETQLQETMPLRDVYEAKLDEYAQKMAELHTDVHTGSGKKMTRKERLALLAEATARDDMEVEGLPEIASKVVEPGVPQLAALTESGEWNMVVVDVKMTTKQTPQGKKSRFSAMVIVGNLSGKGAYGIGVAKEVNDAIFKAIRFAILGAINIPLYRGHTVYYPSKTKFIRTKISIFPRPSDFGISASPIVMQACELLGIRDITVKTHNSRNTRNVVKGLFQALANTPTAAEVAEAKGVYLRERVSRRLFHKEQQL
eukprot:jgi/Ulvmu1/612/UM001_0620.1